MPHLNTDTLVRLRLHKGWSQAETAKQAGINQSYYSQLEKQRKTNPSASVVRKLADAFGVEPSDLTVEDET